MIGRFCVKAVFVISKFVRLQNDRRDTTMNDPQLPLHRVLSVPTPRHFLLVFTLLAGFCGMSMSAESPSPLVGNWQGALNAGGARLRLALSVSDNGGTLSGTLASLDQGGAKMPLTSVTEHDGQVRLKIASIGGSFEGKLEKSGKEIEGTWAQGPNKLPLTFKQTVGETVLSRPQEPKKPLPYREEEVRVPTQTKGVTLAGTLTLPLGAGPHAAVILITGSGPQNRDEALMGHRPFLVLADYLVRQGIAVLRCDDRGIAQSTGDFGKATHEDFVADALAQVAWLEKRREINPRRIGLLGHSEGGVVAPLAAVKAPDHVAFIVLLAGVGVPIDELLVRQGSDVARSMGMNEDVIARSAESQRKLFQRLKLATDGAAAEKLVRETAIAELTEYTPEQQKALGMSQAMIDSQSKMASSPWFRHLLTYDPRPILRQVKCPVLALNGSKDIQVSAKENINGISSALAEGGNKNVKSAILPDLNHLFQTCRTGAVSEYGEIEETMSPTMLSIVSDWIRQETSR